MKTLMVCFRVSSTAFSIIKWLCQKCKQQNVFRLIQMPCTYSLSSGIQWKICLEKYVWQGVRMQQELVWQGDKDKNFSFDVICCWLWGTCYHTHLHPLCFNGGFSQCKPAHRNLRTFVFYYGNWHNSTKTGATSAPSDLCLDFFPQCHLFGSWAHLSW